MVRNDDINGEKSNAMNQPSKNSPAKKLVRRLARGDRDAFVELYDVMERPLFRYLLTKTGNSHAAADVIQEVFARLVKYHKQFRKVDNLNGYVFQVARNESMRWFTKNANNPGVGFDGGVPESVDKSFVDDAESDESVTHILLRLEERDREIVRLKILGELTFAEIGDLLETPTATVATRYRRAINKLESNLERENSSMEQLK